MEEILNNISHLSHEEYGKLMIFFYWFFMFPTIAFVLQVSNWYPFQKSFRTRKEYPWGWTALILIVPFHIIATIGGLMTISMFIHLIEIIVTSIF